MPNIETIKASDAPAPPKKMSKVATELVIGLNGLKKDEVLKLTPDEGKSLRGLKTSVGRISKSEGLKVELWDDGDALYVRRARARSLRAPNRTAAQAAESRMVSSLGIKSKERLGRHRALRRR